MSIVGAQVGMFKQTLHPHEIAWGACHFPSSTIDLSDLTYLGPILLIWIDFKPSMVKKWITCPVKCGIKLLIHWLTSTVQPQKFMNGWAISSHTLLCYKECNYLSMMRQKLIYTSKSYMQCRGLKWQFWGVSLIFMAFIICITFVFIRGLCI